MAGLVWPIPIKLPFDCISPSHLALLECACTNNRKWVQCLSDDHPGPLSHWASEFRVTPATHGLASVQRQRVAWLDRDGIGCKHYEWINVYYSFIDWWIVRGYRDIVGMQCFTRLFMLCWRTIRVLVTRQWTRCAKCVSCPRIYGRQQRMCHSLGVKPFLCQFSVDLSDRVGDGARFGDAFAFDSSQVNDTMQWQYI